MTIIAAWNATAASQNAVTVAADLAKRHKARLHVVHCFEHDLGDSPTRVRRELAAADDAAEAVEGVAASLRDDDLGVTSEVVHGPSGRVADMLLQSIKDQDATMVVMGAEPRSAVTNAVLGSATIELVSRAPCPVVTVRAAASD